MVDRRAVWCVLALWSASSCSGDEADGAPDGVRGGELPEDAPACLVSATVAEIQATRIEQVDLLFAIDNSSSMQEEQAALAEQFPRLVRSLTSGDLRDDGQPDFPPAKTLHLGVVSSDLGLVDVSGVEPCEGLGDDGVLQHAASDQVQGCQASYPPFLAYTADVDEAPRTADDLACIATLGTGGCGIEQPLEAALKALWPAADPGAMNGVNRITFLGPSGTATQGHGDGLNAGFLRNDPAQGRSVLAIVVVTDDEDCSSRETRHFTPAEMLDPSDPLAMQGPNLRCYYNQGKLLPLERYIKGFKALHEDAEHLVVFSAIAGVPPDLVERNDYADVDWSDPPQRDAFYARILNDPRMQETLDPMSNSDLLPSCNTARGRTYPPRRLVNVAADFGINGSVHSLCQEDLSSAIDKIVESIARQLAAPCLPQPLERTANGQIACNVVWELPARAGAPASTPTACDAPGFEFLRPIEGEASGGGALCTVPQLPVRSSGGEHRPEAAEVDGTTFTDGWYYDDFSEAVQLECAQPRGRVSFTAAAEPPAGVTVRLECLNERHIVDSRRPGQVTNEPQPRIGSPCSMVHRNGRLLDGDDACAVRLATPSEDWPDAVDRSMICHPTLKSCALSCRADSDCPDHWSCDDSPDAIDAAGRSLCVPPECSVGEASADAGRVGDPCLPELVPENGFDGDEAYLATGSPHCGDGVCLVYKLAGDPREGCVPRAPNPVTGDPGKSCTSGREVEERVYCSCRCDAPDGSPECACPSGFSCVQALDQGGPALAGGYCVRDGTVAR